MEDNSNGIFDEKGDIDAHREENNTDTGVEESTRSSSPPMPSRSIDYGAPVRGLGDHRYSEMLLPTGYEKVVNWFQEVAAGMQSGDERYDVPQVMFFGEEVAEEINKSVVED